LQIGNFCKLTIFAIISFYGIECHFEPLVLQKCNLPFWNWHENLTMLFSYQNSQFAKIVNSHENRQFAQKNWGRDRQSQLLLDLATSCECGSRVLKLSICGIKHYYNLCLASSQLACTIFKNDFRCHFFFSNSGIKKQFQILQVSTYIYLYM
jgi:hypothetical protein